MRRLGFDFLSDVNYDTSWTATTIGFRDVHDKAVIRLEGTFFMDLYFTLLTKPLRGQFNRRAWYAKARQAGIGMECD